MAMPKVTREIFGRLPDGTAIELIKLFGDNGFEVRLITFGAALQSIFVPDRSGRLADVVLGRDSLEGYLAIRRFLGATIGRYANRIANATFELDGARFDCPLMTAPMHCMAGSPASIGSTGLRSISAIGLRLLSRCPTSAQTAKRVTRAGCKPRSPTVWQVAWSYRSNSPRRQIVRPSPI
jgi:Aldose 1-epimerase